KPAPRAVPPIAASIPATTSRRHRDGRAAGMHSSAIPAADVHGRRSGAALARDARFRVRPSRLVRYRLGSTPGRLVLGWLPLLVHGPIPEKLAAVRLNGAIAVWCYYSARLLIGFMVGVGTWPAPWWARGPLYGFVLMVPPGCLALATPGCGFT